MAADVCVRTGTRASWNPYRRVVHFYRAGRPEYGLGEILPAEMRAGACDRLVRQMNRSKMSARRKDHIVAKGKAEQKYRLRKERERVAEDVSPEAADEIRWARARRGMHSKFARSVPVDGFKKENA